MGDTKQDLMLAARSISSPSMRHSRFFTLQRKSSSVSYQIEV